MTERPQTAFAAAFKRAGLNVAEARLRQLAMDALKKHHRNIGRALPTFESSVEDDPELIREALLHYLCHIDHGLSDGSRPPPDTQKFSATDQQNGGAGLRVGDAQVGVARPVREPSEGQRSAMVAVAKAAAVTILDRVKTSDGRPWGNVGAHELDGMARDGALAKAIVGKLGVLTNAQRFMPLRDLMPPQHFEEVYNSVREQSQ